MSNYFIPSKIKVGFQKRDDCYTKSLGYVIYQDKAGEWRKTKSWESWRDSKIDALEFDNKPMDGFVLNRAAGGVRESWSHNARIERVRVFDPRNFEFEITIPNLLMILRETDCSRGKGLEGKFIYAWRKTELVLLPVGCQEYKEATEFTKLAGNKISPKTLVPGISYTSRDVETFMYVGRYPIYNLHRSPHFKFGEYAYIFLNSKNKFDIRKSVNFLARQDTDVPDSNLNDYVERFLMSSVGSPAKEFTTKALEGPLQPNTFAFKKTSDTTVESYYKSHYYDWNRYQYLTMNPEGQLQSKNAGTGRLTGDEAEDLHRLFVVLRSGSVIELKFPYGFYDVEEME